LASPSILIVRLGALGDVVHAMPVVAAVRAAWPACRIGWLVHQPYAKLVSRVRGVDAVYPVRRALDMATMGAVRAARYDVCLDLQGLMKSAAYARASGARRVVGFSRDLLREPLAALVYGETGGEVGGHVIDKNLSLLRRLGIEPGPPRIDLDVPDSPAVAGVYELIRRIHDPRGTDSSPRSTVYGLRSTAQGSSPAVHSLRSDDEVTPASPRRGFLSEEPTPCSHQPTPFILLNPGAGWPNKQWPADRFGQLAARVRDATGLPSVVLWGPREASLAAAVVRSSDGAAVMAPQSDLDDMLAVLRAASVVVAGDTGPLHLAAAVGTPVVGLFGPTPPERNGPWHPDDLVVSRHAQCRCVFKRACTSAPWCLGEVGVEEVARAVLARLHQQDT
jgi:ADP-heptose:LPS heptosyltransferase